MKEITRSKDSNFIVKTNAYVMRYSIINGIHIILWLVLFYLIRPFLVNFFMIILSFWYFLILLGLYFINRGVFYLLKSRVSFINERLVFWYCMWFSTILSIGVGVFILIDTK